MPDIQMDQSDREAQVAPSTPDALLVAPGRWPLPQNDVRRSSLPGPILSSRTSSTCTKVLWMYHCRSDVVPKQIATGSKIDD